MKSTHCRALTPVLEFDFSMALPNPQKTTETQKQEQSGSINEPNFPDKRDNGKLHNLIGK